MKVLKIREVQLLLLDLMKNLHQFLNNNQLPYYMIGGSALGSVRHQGFIPWDDDIDIGMFREDYEKFLKISNNFDSRYEIVNLRVVTNCDFCLTRIYLPNTKIDNPTIEKTCLDKRLYLDIFPLDNVPENEMERKKYEKRIKNCKRIISLTDVRDNGNPLPAMLIKNILSFCLNPFRNLILKHTEKLMLKYREKETKLVCSLCSQYSFARQVMDKSVYGKPVLSKFEDAYFYIPEKFGQYFTTLYGADYMDIPPESKRRKGYDIYLIEEN